jgi:hypothetical protein
MHLQPIQEDRKLIVRGSIFRFVKFYLAYLKAWKYKCVRGLIAINGALLARKRSAGIFDP